MKQLVFLEGLPEEPTPMQKRIESCRLSGREEWSLSSNIGRYDGLGTNCKDSLDESGETVQQSRLEI